MTSEDPESVSARLRRESADHRLRYDAAQLAAAARLDAMREELELRRRPPPVLQLLRSSLPWLASRTADAPPRGLYLWGGVGRGKTLLMDLFFASLRDVRAAGRAERSHFYHFMRAVHADLGGIRGRTEPLESVARRIARRTRVICLDEFMVTDIADAMILAGLFAGLFRHGVALVATSNLPPQDLYAEGLQRQRFLPAIELIQSHVDVLHLDGGSDYRLRELERAPTYFDGGRPDAPAVLEARFAALAGGSATGPAVLSVEGRALRAVATGPDMAWFEFQELCEGPRSQNDYIELARLYGTLFIANIPIFMAQDEDSARRFIMLIDELYDRGVKTVVSAAAAPDALYRGDRLHNEFRRAASRLMEMQTQAYHAGRHRA